MHPYTKGHAFEGHFWAQPRAAHLRELMRRVVENPGEAAEKGREARRTMVDRYAPGVVGRAVAREARRIRSEVEREAEKRKGGRDDL